MLSPTEGCSVGLSHLSSKHADALRLTSNIISISHQGVNSSWAQHQTDFSASRQQSQHQQSLSPPKRETCSLVHSCITHKHLLCIIHKTNHILHHTTTVIQIAVLIQVYHPNLHRTHITHTNGYILRSHALSYNTRSFLRRSSSRSQHNIQSVNSTTVLTRSSSSAQCVHQIQFRYVHRTICYLTYVYYFTSGT